MSQDKNCNLDEVDAGLGKKDDASAQRRGPKGYFRGSRRDLLENNLPAYLASQKGSRQNFWHSLFSSWWRQYPWKLDDSQEPPTDPVEMVNLKSVGSGEIPEKEVVEKRLMARVKQWYVNRASAANSGNRRDNLAWTPLLERLHQIRNTHPRQRTPVQQFMRDYPTEVKTAFATKYGDGKALSKADRMNFQHSVAKTLLYEENVGLISGLEAKAKAEHAVGEKEWKLILDDISAAEDVAKARDSLFDAVYPLLQAIGTYAGCYVSLIAGNTGNNNSPSDGFLTAVHWWPGDRSSTGDWTQWDERGFNTGVAGPFLKYARDTNHLLGATGEKSPSSTVKGPQVSTSLTLPNDIAVVPSPPNGTPARIRQTTTRGQVKSRPRPTPLPKVAEASKKRKYTPKVSPSVHCSEDSRGDDAGNNSGDGSSSGDSLPNIPTLPKRPRVSRITTRSSARTSDMGVALDPTSPAPTMRGLSTANPVTRTPNCDLRITTLAVTTPVGSPDLCSADAFGDDMDTDVTPLPETGDPIVIKTGASHNAGVKGPVPTDTGDLVTMAIKDLAPTSIEFTTAINAKDPVAINSDDSIASAVKDANTADAEVPTTTNAINHTTTNVGDPTGTNVKVSTATETTLHSPSSPVSSGDIDEANVPSFLIRHGKGRRQVNIFKYLGEVEDSHFQQVLFRYLRFEMNDKSQMGGSLSTANRPIEIALWTSKARPAGIPDYTTGGRTFTNFVDSAFGWWTSIQPPWRKFSRSTTSRKVKGGWEALYSPRINGLLNVVILAYWWIRILEECKPEDGLRADFEFFAADVAWVLSKLSN